MRPHFLFLTGTLSQSSDRNIKSAFEEVDPQDVLQKVSELPVDSWQFNFDPPHRSDRSRFPRSVWIGC